MQCTVICCKEGDVRLLFVAAIHGYGTNAQKKGRLYFKWLFFFVLR